MTSYPRVHGDVDDLGCSARGVSEPRNVNRIVMFSLDVHIKFLASVVLIKGEESSTLFVCEKLKWLLLIGS